MKALSMNIILDEMKFYSFHGVMHQENIVGSIFKVNLNIETDFSNAVISDNLKDTVNYAEVYNIVKQEMDKPSDLLEHLAYRICKCLFEKFSIISQIKISIFKENPPFGGDCKNVGIKICYKR